MVFSITLYNKGEAFLRQIVLRGVSDLVQFKDDYYRVLISLDEDFLRDLESRTRIKFHDDSFYFELMKIDGVTFTDRFATNSHVTIRPKKIQDMKGDEIRYLAQLVYKRKKCIMHLMELKTTTGRLGEANVIVDWLCNEVECSNLALSCIGGYCPDHCEKCGKPEQCSLVDILYPVIGVDNYVCKLSMIERMEEKLGSLKDEMKSVLLTYKTYNEFLKTYQHTGGLPIEVSGVRFALVSKLLSEIAPNFDNILVKSRGDSGGISRQLILDLYEMGITKFVDEARGYAVAAISTDHFAYGFFHAIAGQLRRRPSCVLVNTSNGPVLCRQYYGGLFIPPKYDSGFWSWFQRLESSLSKETNEEQSQNIGKRIFDDFGEEILRTLGSRFKIIDYGGGTGDVLTNFLDFFLKRVPASINLEVRLIDLDSRSLEMATKNIFSILEKHGFDRRSFAAINGDIFATPIDRTDVSIVSQVLELYTEMTLHKLAVKHRLENTMLELLKGILKDKAKSDKAGVPQWEETVKVACNHLSPYYYIISRLARFTLEEFNPSTNYTLETCLIKENMKWVKEVAKYSNYMIVADRLLQEDLLHELGLKVIKGKTTGRQIPIFMCRKE